MRVCLLDNKLCKMEKTSEKLSILLIFSYVVLLISKTLYVFLTLSSLVFNQ